MIEKKSTKYILLGFAFALFLCGKQEAKAQFSIGLKGGYNFSSVTFEPDISTEFRTGYTGGLVFRNSIKPNVGLIAEINYTQKGWTELFPRTDILDARRAYFEYDYIEVPFMTHIYFGGGFAKVILNLGPHFSYLLSQNSYAELAPGDEITYNYTEENTIKFEYGISIGAGLRFNLGKAGDLHVEFRAAQGLNNILDREQPDTPIGSQNLAMGAQVTYFINIAGSDPTKKATKDAPEGD
ncbi:porin family protein [Flammeovirgaceae bacterium SG7u.111]|nr:porin family protein [Flammeovirgaceae bacterium SG7u.132]WPO34097.1 porin family protein [Flammeovirgaceae bacterium SG7u.111]